MVVYEMDVEIYKVVGRLYLVILVYSISIVLIVLCICDDVMGIKLLVNRYCIVN